MLLPDFKFVNIAVSFKNLLCQIEIVFRSNTLSVVEQRRFTMTWRLIMANIPADIGFINLVFEKFLDFFGNL